MSCYKAISLFTANGIKCYTCTACPESEIGKQEDCEPQYDACSKIKTKIKGKEIHKKCFTKGKGKPGGVLEKITGVGCVGNACVCDTDLCNGSSTLEMRPIIFAISGVLTRFVFQNGLCKRGQLLYSYVLEVSKSKLFLFEPHHLTRSF